MCKNRGIYGFLCTSWVLITMAMAPVIEKGSRFALARIIISCVVTAFAAPMS